MDLLPQRTGNADDYQRVRVPSLVAEPEILSNEQLPIYLLLFQSLVRKRPHNLIAAAIIQIQ